MNRGFRFIPEQASTMAGSIDHLALFLLAVTVFFTLLILVLITFLSLRYQRKPDDFHSPNPPATRTHMALEMTWTFIPLGIVMVMFVWGAQLFVAQSKAPDRAMEINIMGKQWMWKAQHPDGRREINELTVPVGVPVRLVMTSQDVIHDFYIPAFRIKQDVIPGRYSYQWFEATEPGTYRLYCAEYCGTQHSGMIGQVRVLKPADYQRWLAGSPQDIESPVDAGAKLFTQFACAQCHGQRGPSLSGVYQSQRQVLLSNGSEQTVKADYDYLRESILYPRAKIVKGYAPDLMPGYQGQLSEEQLVQLIAYIKTLGAGGRPGAGAGGGTQMDVGSKMQELNPPPPDLSTYQSNSHDPR